MSNIIIADIIFILLLVGLSIPLGIYIYKVMSGQKVFLSKLLMPLENSIYKVCGINPKNEMTAKNYLLNILIFSGIGLVFLFVLQIVQGILPFNPQNLKSVDLSLAFNTAASFVSNTNWQAYAGESTMTYLTQSIGLVVQNFISAGVGISVLFALIRGFIQKETKTIGNFWQDMVRVIIFILLPLSLVLAILLVAGGVVQTIMPYKEITSLQDGISQIMPLGPAASQIAIKQLGTNGGGFFGANSAYPLENPNNFTNLIQLLSILLIPAALCISFGKAVKDIKQGITIYSVMLILFLLALSAVTFNEFITGNLIGKEVTHGIGMSSLWSVATTAASNGSVNAMLDSFAPLSGMVLLFLMQVGEVIFGGVGSGLYGMLAFVLLTVFIAGLMVGRTPEYLGKKIEPYDMKMICMVILVPPVLTLIGTAVAVMMPDALSWLSNKGAHGFSEILYAFSSMANNNGSAFGGFNANTNFTNIFGGLIMLMSRYLPIAGITLLAGNLSSKKFISVSEGTLKTTGVTFTVLLISIIVIVAALSFLPALALGPIADYFTNIR